MSDINQRCHTFLSLTCLMTLTSIFLALHLPHHPKVKKTVQFGFHQITLNDTVYWGKNLYFIVILNLSKDA